MSTRKAKDDSVFHQARYASSPEFERGLIANLVARRCSVLDNKADRELVWFLQYLSHQAGGIPDLAGNFLKQYPDQLQTPAMAKLGIRAGKNCNADKVKAIRQELPLELRDKFLLKGENDILDIMSASDRANNEEFTDAAFRRAGRAAINLEQKAKAYPVSYPAALFIELCQDEARQKLENYLREICVNPAIKLDAGPWYFPTLIDVLRQYKNDFVAAMSTGAFTTALGQKVFDVLEYTAYCRGLTLMQGEARLGKSHAARSWCVQHPGRARFVEVPSGNDDATFFRDLARGLGLGNFLNYKVVQIRERVESVLLTGDIVLVLDEAQRLWPQCNLREGFPRRIVWVMTMARAF